MNFDEYIRFSDLENPVFLNGNKETFSVVVNDITREEIFKDLYFYQWAGKMDGEIYLELIFKINGISNSLREGRHSYFGDGGYINYLNAKNLILCLDYCKKYFDMD